MYAHLPVLSRVQLAFAGAQTQAIPKTTFLIKMIN
jgi:hypothetical protein